MIEIYSAVLRGIMVEPIKVLAVERRGIPRIEWIGIPHHLGKIWKQKIGVLAHQLQLSLKSQIISISVSPPIVEADADQVELAVITSVLGLLLKHTQLQPAFAIGAVALDGKVSGGRGHFALRQQTELDILSGPVQTCHTQRVVSIERVEQIVDWINGKKMPSTSIATIKKTQLSDEQLAFFASLHPFSQLAIQLQLVTQAGTIFFNWTSSVLAPWQVFLQEATPVHDVFSYNWMASIHPERNRIEWQSMNELHMKQVIRHQDELNQHFAKAYPGYIHFPDVRYWSTQLSATVQEKILQLSQKEKMSFRVRPHILLSVPSCLCAKSDNQTCQCSRKELGTYQRNLATWQSICPLVLFPPSPQAKDELQAFQFDQERIEYIARHIPAEFTPTEQLHAGIALLMKRKEDDTTRQVLQLFTQLPKGYS